MTAQKVGKSGEVARKTFGPSVTAAATICDSDSEHLYTTSVTGTGVCAISLHFQARNAFSCACAACKTKGNAPKPCCEKCISRFFRKSARARARISGSAPPPAVQQGRDCFLHHGPCLTGAGPVRRRLGQKHRHPKWENRGVAECDYAVSTSPALKYHQTWAEYGRFVREGWATWGVGTIDTRLRPSRRSHAGRCRWVFIFTHVVRKPSLSNVIQIKPAKIMRSACRSSSTRYSWVRGRAPSPLFDFRMVRHTYTCIMVQSTKIAGSFRASL